MANASAVVSAADQLDVDAHVRADERAHARDELILKLRSATPAPISTLSPALLAAHPHTVLRGQVTVTWPMSRLKRTVAFVIADPKQVVLRFRGPVAGIVGDHNVGAGDEVLVCLQGAELEADDASLGVSLGRSVGWRIVMAAKVQMLVLKHDDATPIAIDFDDPTVPSSINQELAALLPNHTEAATAPPVTEFPPALTPSQKRAASTLDADEYMSPAFLKRARVSYGSLFADGLDIFKEDDEKHDELGPARGRLLKKRPFSGPSGMWRYSSRSRSPVSEPEPQLVHEEQEIGRAVYVNDAATHPYAQLQDFSASATSTQPHGNVDSREAAQISCQDTIINSFPHTPPTLRSSITSAADALSDSIEDQFLSSSSYAFPPIPESLSATVTSSHGHHESGQPRPIVGTETLRTTAGSRCEQISDTTSHIASRTSPRALPNFDDVPSLHVIDTETTRSDMSRETVDPALHTNPFGSRNGKSLVDIELLPAALYESSTSRALHEPSHVHHEPSTSHVHEPSTSHVHHEPSTSHVHHEPFTATRPEISSAGNDSIEFETPCEPGRVVDVDGYKSQGDPDENKDEEYQDQDGDNDESRDDGNLDNQDQRPGRSPELTGHRVDPPPPEDPEDDGYDENDSDYHQDIGGDYDIRNYADVQDDEEGLGDNVPSQQALEDAEKYEYDEDEDDDEYGDDEEEDDENDDLVEAKRSDWDDGESGSESNTPTTSWTPRQPYIPKSPEYISLLSSDDEAEQKPKPSRRPASPRKYTQPPGQTLDQDAIDSESVLIVEPSPEEQSSSFMPISGAPSGEDVDHPEDSADDMDIDQDKDQDGAESNPASHQDARDRDAMDFDVTEGQGSGSMDTQEADDTSSADLGQTDIAAILSRPLIPPVLKDLPEPARRRPAKPRRRSSELDPDFTPDDNGVEEEEDEEEEEEEREEKERRSRRSTPSSQTKRPKGRRLGKNGGDADDDETGAIASSPAAQAKATKSRRSIKDPSYVPDAAYEPDEQDEEEQGIVPKRRPKKTRRSRTGAESAAEPASDAHDPEAPSTTTPARAKPKPTQRHAKEPTTPPPHSADAEDDEIQPKEKSPDPSVARAKPKKTRRSQKDPTFIADATADQDDEDAADFPAPGAKTRRSLRSQKASSTPAALTDEPEPVAQSAESPARVTRSRGVKSKAGTPVKQRSPGSSPSQPQSTRRRQSQKDVNRTPSSLSVRDASILDSEGFSPASIPEKLMLIARGSKDNGGAGTPSPIDMRHPLLFTELLSPASHEQASFASQMGSTDDPSIQLARESAGLASKGAGRRTGGSGTAHQLTPSKLQDADPSVQLARASASRRSARLKESSPALDASPHTRTRSHSLRMSESPTAAESLPVDDTNSLKLELIKDLRLNLGSYTQLKVLRHHPNKTVDAVAVVVSDPLEPKRPKPHHDYITTLTVTDPSTAPTGVTQVQIMRPKAGALPSARRGDIVLLRQFKVLAAGGKGPTLRANEGSAWAVFERGRDDALPQINGPPVEWVAEEQAHAEKLGRWWCTLDETCHQKLEKAISKLAETAKV